MTNSTRRLLAVLEEIRAEIRHWQQRAFPRPAPLILENRSPGAIDRRRRRGVTVVQTAVVLNVCLMFLLGLFDFSRVIMMRQLVTNAAREGCRYAVVNTDSATTAQVQAYVTNYLCGQQINNLTISVYEADPTTGANIGTWTNAGLSNSIGVQIAGTMSTMTPTFSLLPGSILLQATSIMASEAN